MKEQSKIFFLTGFMGVGKSYWCKILSNELGWKGIDLDEEIVKEEGRTIAETIKESGEKAFRQLERKMLIQLTGQLQKGIVSLGGGTLLDERNLALVKQCGKLIWLKKDNQLISDDAEVKKRPLYDPEELNDLYSERVIAYKRADHIIQLDDLESEQSKKENLLNYICGSLNL